MPNSVGVDCCSNQAAHASDAGRQIFATPPAWTLKGRIYENEIAKSPGPVYDASRGYTYLEQVHVTDTAAWTCPKQQRQVHDHELTLKVNTRIVCKHLHALTA